MAAIRTVVDMFRAAAARYRGRPVFRVGVDNSRVTSFRAFDDRVTSWAAGLMGLGLEAGESVAILARTSPRWITADMAILAAGGVTVPVYPTLLARDVAFVVHDSGAVIAVCEDPFQVEKLLANRAAMPKLRHIVCLEVVGHRGGPDSAGRTELTLDAVASLADGVVTVADLEARGDQVPAADVDARAAALSADNACTIVYTCGASGRPKGVVLCHDAFVFGAQAIVEALDLRDDDAMLVHLPLAHVFGRLVTFVCLFRGVQMRFTSAPHRLIEELTAIDATIIPTVPRLLEKARTAIEGDIPRGGVVKARVVQRALEVARTVQSADPGGAPLPVPVRVAHQLARKWVYPQLRAPLGARLRYIISGGAPLPVELARFFDAIEVPIVEGYGLTETGAVATLNRLSDYRLGTVGRPLPGVEVCIADDGEILLRGRNCLSAYHDRPDATQRAFDSEGWLRTGDIGELDSDGYLRITDRKKDIIVTASGKSIAPQNIEAHIKNDPIVSEVMVYGDRRHFLSALITLDEHNVKRWASANDVPWSSYQDMVQRPEVYRLVESVIQRKNRGLASYETIKKFAVLDIDLSEENGDLTPTLKVKREAMAEKHARLLDSFYRDGY